MTKIMKILNPIKIGPGNNSKKPRASYSKKERRENE